jgi:quinoprotein glucose dehydrogenase
MAIDVPVDGSVRAAVAQLTKTGHLFLLERHSGEPLFPVEERAVPQTSVPGEYSAPTQPFPTFPPPLHVAGLSADDAWGFTPFDRSACRGQIEGLRNEGIFTPPSFEGSVLYPGTAGGVNWGSAAYDAERRLLVFNQNHIAQVVRLIPREDVVDWTPDNHPPGVMLQEGTPYVLQNQVLVSPLGAPCISPPWGTLMAVDLERGEVAWQRPFGTTRDMTPLPLGFDFGLPSMGGPIVTASGLVFIGASMDDYIRAYDILTGEELWRQRLPAGAQATPMTYQLEPNGPQWLVIAAGGHATLGTRLGDHVIAYALPH